MYVNGSTMRHFHAAMVSEPTMAAWAKRYPPRGPRVPVRMTQSGGRPRIAHRVETSSAGSGRPLDEIPASVIEAIRGYMRAHGEAPSSNWVYCRTKEMLPTGGYNRAKTRRAIEEARMVTARV